MALIGSELATKYAILGRQAGAAETQASAALLGAQGRSALDYANAGQAAGLAASENALRGHQGGLADAQGNYYTSEADKNRFLAPHQANLLDQQGSYYGAQGRRTNTQTDQDFGAAPGIDPLTGAPDAGYAKGTANVPASPAEIDFFHQHLKAQHGMNKVPGKGPSTVDTVPAMLAPREAVLNEHAADLIGRDKIAAANAIGVAHQKAQGKGMVSPKAAGQQGYAEGTSYIEPIMETNYGVTPTKNYYATTPQYPRMNWMNEQAPPVGNRAIRGQVSPDEGGATPAGATGYAEGTPSVSGTSARAVDWLHGSSPQQGAGDGDRVMDQKPGPWSSPQQPKPQKLAGGTHMVGHGKSAKTPTKIDPQALLSLMGAMQGGQAGGPPQAPMQGPGGMV